MKNSGLMSDLNDDNVSACYSSKKSIRIGIIAGEASGDLLGASLIQELKQYYPNALFEGVGGPKMIAQGFHSFYAMDRLSVMGFIEPLKRLFEILSMRKRLVQHFVQSQPQVFIGIDSPDFNLSIEYQLRQKGIKTVHYVSPTVWAWRQKRIKKIKKAVDLMLSLFPFENKIYQDNQIENCCVGHPLANAIPLSSDKMLARQALKLPTTNKIVAILPGSREQELNYLAKSFIETAQWLLQRDPSIQVITACPTELIKKQLEAILEQMNFSAIKIFLGQSTQVMAASDAILVASGTASLEAMLVKRPTVIAYKMSPLTFEIAKRIVKVPYIGLPNLLAGRRMIPEFIQSQVIPSQMGQTLLDYLSDPNLETELKSQFEKIHLSLKTFDHNNPGKKIAQLIKE